MGSGEALNKLPSGSGQSPAAKRFLVHFQLFNGPLVTILWLEKNNNKTGFYDILNAVFTFYFPEDFPSQPAESFNLSTTPVLRR